MPVIHRNRLSTTRLSVLFVALAALASLLGTLVIPSAAEAVETSELGGRTVFLINAETGRFLDGDGSGAVGQSRSPVGDDKWLVTDLGANVFTFENDALGGNLDADGQFTDFDVDLSNGDGTDSQWLLTDIGGGAYEITNVEHGMNLTSVKSGRAFDVGLTDSTSADAHWFVGIADLPAEELDGATVLLANKATGRFLDADRNNRSVGQSAAPRADDQWIVEAEDGYVTFRNTAIDRLLHGTVDDVDIAGEGDLATKWALRQRGNGSFEIKNAAAGRWLDADPSGGDFNVDLTTQVNNDQANWYLIVVDTLTDCVADEFASINDLLGCVDAADTFVHLRALQDIADANGGIRQSGTPGFDQSADYVAGILEAAGLSIERQKYDFSVFTVDAQALTVNGAERVVEDDFLAMTFSAGGEVSDGNLVYVDLDLGLDNASTSGCEPEDFDELDFSGPNDIAVIQRGACAFADKAINAQNVGAEGVIIFNQGNTEDRIDTVFGTLGSGAVGTIAIPVFGTSYEVGLALLIADASASMVLDATTETAPTENIIADLPGINPNNVVMAGSHLDSVPAGPGIQDNGSGTAALLAIALAMANNETYVPQNTMRFAWWGAEEFGLIGSEEYIFNPDFGLTQEEFDALALYLNFDMIGSPNYVYGIYDADQSSFEAPVPIPPGSDVLEDLFEAYYSIDDVPYEDTQFSGRSDYQAFINVGIPASGLFTGAEEIKTPEQVGIWGGTAGQQFDPCYHLECDTIDNVSYEAMETNVDAVAYALYLMAASTETVNGVPGVGVQGITPDEVEFDGPQGTFIAGGGGLGPHSGHNHFGAES